MANSTVTFEDLGYDPVSRNDCIEWEKSRNTQGYGKKWVGNGKTELVHRLAWEEEHGPIPKGLWVLHKCDNPPCFNVDHLFLGNHSRNLRDSFIKGLHVPYDRNGDRNPRAILTWDQVNEIRERARRGFKHGDKTQLAREYGVALNTMCEVISGKHWKIKSG